MLKRRAFSLTAAIVEADGPADEVALMRSAPWTVCVRRRWILHRSGAVREPVSGTH